MVRNSKKTSFVYPKGESFRVVDRNNKHYKFIKKFGSIYSTSANESGANFDVNFAIEKCDVEVLTNKKYFESDASSIIKFGKTKYTKIR
jgi:tRNA A37 threonylcarbamoyladenosine synthetase subunit TsaC/SUA5/YrdC